MSETQEFPAHARFEHDALPYRDRLYSAARRMTRNAMEELEVLDRLTDPRVKEAMRQLNKDFRLTIYLADVEGFSYREIAAIMGVPAGTVMSRLHRARHRLRELLPEYALRHDGQARASHAAGGAMSTAARMGHDRL